MYGICGSSLLPHEEVVLVVSSYGFGVATVLSAAVGITSLSLF